MQVFSTLHRRLVDLVPRHPGEISMYVCGATVQSEPHIGHGRYAVVFDTIRRYLSWRGNRVTYVRNITDIDDKIIVAAAEAGETVAGRAERIASIFAECYRQLGVDPPDIEPRATEHTAEMVALIEQLIARDLAYVAANGDVYFSVRSYPEYGRLSGRNPDEMLAGARVEVSEWKRDPLDFALWKAAKPGEPQWPSPWGPGRPGWHIECSAMAARYLGAGFDIHGGGADLIFPHHENEIAQSEGATGEPFARYWLHNGMVNLEGAKMSKSTGQLIDLQEAIRQRGGMSLRLLFLRAHYRSPIEFSEELLAAAAAAYERLGRFLERAPDPRTGADQQVMARFRQAMDHDFATPEALAVMFDALGEANRRLDAGEDPQGLVAAVHEIAGVLGLRAGERTLAGLDGELAALGAEQGVTAGGPEQVLDGLLEVRRQARAGGDYRRADLIRDRLAGLGIVIEDTPDGARWLRR
jgi:cysteinyl-tRNA synthetase